MSFLTPLAALIALVGAVPLAAFVIGERRRRRVNELLRLPPPSERSRLAPGIALAVIAALLGVAATQPTLVRRSHKQMRTDAEAWFVLDTSLSMKAAAGPGAPTRFERAQSLAERLRHKLAHVPVRVASITDRALPHLFPTPDSDTFDVAVHKVMG